MRVLGDWSVVCHSTVEAASQSEVSTIIFFLILNLELMLFSRIL